MKIRAALVSFVVAVTMTFATAPGAVASVPDDTVPETNTIGTNDFIPENVNLGDCLSSMPRPNCGTKNRSSTGTWLTFGALMAGMGFIGWRISRSVRARDRQQNP